MFFRKKSPGVMRAILEDKLRQDAEKHAMKIINLARDRWFRMGYETAVNDMRLKQEAEARKIIMGPVAVPAIHHGV